VDIKLFFVSSIHKRHSGTVVGRALVGGTFNHLDTLFDHLEVAERMGKLNLQNAS